MDTAKENIQLLAISIPIFLLFFIILIIGIVLIKRRQNFIKNGIVTTAILVRPLFGLIKVRYKVGEKELEIPYYVRVNLFNKLYSYKDGDSIEIKYNPKNITQFAFTHDSSSSAAGVILIVLGVSGMLFDIAIFGLMFFLNNL